MFYAAVGCERCRQTGYQGRIGLFEILSCNPRLVEQLLKCHSGEEMTRFAVAHGMRTLLADGMYKAVEGETTIEEVPPRHSHLALKPEHVVTDNPTCHRKRMCRLVP